MSLVEESAWSTTLLDGLASPATPDWKPAFVDGGGWTVFLDEEVEDWLTDRATDAALRKRVFYCLRELVVSGRCGRVKSVKGAGRGWLRSPLGGTGGSHFYLWWARHGSPALEGRELNEGDILVRAVRHHDETSSALDPGSPDRWTRLPLPAIHDTGTASPFTADQLDIAVRDPNPVRVVRGLPGSGKTTALYLAASFSTGPKALYITYSKGLARAAEDHFRVFGPAGTAIDVLTWADLLVETAGPAAPSLNPLDPRSGAGLLEDRLRSYHQPLGPWQGRSDELYAELHAHSVGRALPMPFRKLPATQQAVLSAAVHVDVRGDAIGAQAAGIAASVAEHLCDAAAIESLFPGPGRARALIVGYDDPPPSRFAGVTSIIVDEVQDLTPVEAALLFSLAGRIGRHEGVMPSLLLAGDEAQTVRPTAFEWGWFNDLLATMLGGYASDVGDHSLSSSLRAPRTIAGLIAHLQEQYRRLDKADRPGGMAYGDADFDLDGTLVYCRVSDAEQWSDVHHFFEAAPDARLVYPGHRVPPGLVANAPDGSSISTSQQVKGLDYQVIGVVDAGRRELDLRQLAEQAEAKPLLGLWARSLADQFRVAVSRTRDTLVLLDNGMDDLTSVVKAMCGPEVVDDLREVQPHKLSSLLDEDLDPMDHVQAAIDEAERVIDDDPLRALQRMRNVRRYVDDAHLAGDLDEMTERDVNHLHGIAAALVVQMPDAVGGSEHDRAPAEAARHLAAAGQGSLYELVAGADAVLDRPASDVALEWAARSAAAVPEVARNLAPLEPGFRASIRHWVISIQTGDHLPTNDDQIPVLLESLTAVIGAVESSHPELAGDPDDFLLRAAATAERLGRFDAAVMLYRQADEPHPVELGRCLEASGRWTEALEVYREADMDSDALRSREVADFELAEELAESSDPAVADLMRWAAGLISSVDPEVLGVGVALTDAEYGALVEHLTTALERARTARPGVRPPLTSPRSERDRETSEPPEKAEPIDEPAVVAPAPPEEPPSRGEAALWSIDDLSSELGISTEACVSLCARLGVPAVDGNSTVTDLMADRVRRRALREGLASG